MDPITIKERQQRQRRLTLASFLLPTLVLYLAYALQGVFPFGDRHILTVDLYHQYAPFLGELRSKLLAGESLFFSWSAGLGVNFYAIFTYYLASPFNALMLLFPKTGLSDAILLITLLKVGAAGLSFHHYLKRFFLRDGPLAVALSSAYALSSYVLAYSWNIMWLDSLIFLPMAALGLVYLLREQRVLPYVFWLFLLIYSNYYTGFFACILLFFFFCLLMERYGQKRPLSLRFLLTAKFLLASLLAAGMSMVTLLPTLYNLQRTSAAGDSFPKALEAMDIFVDFFSRLLPLSPLAVRSGMPNLYAGLLLLPLLFVYVASRRIPFRRKVLHLSLLAFFLLSFHNNVLNFLWHGLHYPNQLPFRNAFVFVFLALSMAYEALPSVKDLGRGQSFQFAAAVSLILLLLAKLDGERYPGSMLFISIVLLFVYAFLLSGMHKRYASDLLPFALAVVLIAELGAMTFLGVESIAKNEYYGNKQGYSTGAEVEEMHAVLEGLQQGQGDLVRTEILPDHSVNDAMLFQSQGLSIFASTFPKEPVAFFKHLGFPNNGINSFQYCGSTLVADTILGIDYLIHRDPFPFKDRLRSLEAGQKEIELRQNKDAFPLCFLAPAEILGGSSGLPFSTTDLGPFKVQDSLAYQLAKGPPLFTEYSLEMGEATGGSVTRKQEEGFLNNFDLRRTGSPGQFKFRLNVETSGHYYLAWRSDSQRPDKVEYLPEGGASVRLGTKTRSMADLGLLIAGEHLEFVMHFRNEDTKGQGNFKLFAAKLNEEAYQDFVKTVKDRPSKVIEHSASRVVVEATAEEDQVLLMTSSYDPGWQCQVDGEPVAIQHVDHAIMAVELPPGSHRIVWTFRPQGFLLGLGISAGSLLIFMALVFHALRRRSQRRKKAKPALQRSETQGTEVQGETHEQTQ